MAAPTYATDLTVIDDFESGDNTLEPTATWTAGRANTTDTDYPIQSSTHASLTMNTTGKAGLLTDASPVTWTSGDYLFGWLIWLAPGAIQTQASGGLVMLAGSSGGNYKVFYVGGSDYGTYPYGGWQNFVVDPEGTADETIGTPDGDYDFVGVGSNVSSAVAKGNPLGMDVFRSGRGELRVGAGDGTTPATFAGMATANDASTARWGLFQEIVGGYLFKGNMILGYTACTFDDSDKSITIDNTEFVASTFNAIEIKNATSNITWTNIKVTSLSSTSPGTFEVVDNATVLLDTCGFTDMGTFDFLSNTTVQDCTFKNCGQITTGGADMTGSIVDGYSGTAGTGAMYYNQTADPDGEFDNMAFTKDATLAHHAIEFGTSAPTTMTLRGIDFSGFSGTSTSATLGFLRTSGTTTVNLVGCTGTITAEVTGTHTVNFVTNPVTLNVHVIDSDSGADIADARVYVLAATTGPLPFEDTVTITRVTTTATVAHTAHGLATNQWVKIEGADQEEYNGAKQITKIDADSYSYTVSGTPTTPATGTIDATAVIIFGTTDANGEISDTRSYGSDQDFTGRVRKSSASPYYKTTSLTGTVDSSNGLSLTAGMIKDE